MKKIKIVLLIIAAFLLANGVAKRTIPPQSHKLYRALLETNEQGVREVLESGKMVDLEYLCEVPFLYDNSSLLFAIDHEGIPDAVPTPEYSASIIMQLIENGANVNRGVSDLDGEYILWFVARRVKNPEVIQRMIDAGCDVNRRNLISGNSALDSMYYYMNPANEEEYMEKIQMIMKAGGKLTAHTLKSCLQSGAGNVYAEDLLDQLEADHQWTGTNKALRAAIRGDNDTILSLKKITKYRRREILCYAAANCSVEALKHLEELGAELENVTNKDGYSAFAYAARYNTTDAIAYFEELLNDEVVWGIITEAVKGGKKENVEYLLNHGYTWYIHEDLYEEGTWAVSVDEGNGSSIGLMLELGYEPSKEEIMKAYSQGCESVVDVLLKNKISYDFKCDGRTVYDLICEENLTRGEKFYENGIGIDLGAVISVIGNGGTELAKRMIEDYKEELDLEDVLNYAIRRGNFELVQFLVEQGADVNLRMKNGSFNGKDVRSEIEEIDYFCSFTPIFAAAVSPSEEILQYLLDVGGDASFVNSSDKTAYDYAEKLDLTGNMELLRKAEAE
jgi:ankyrin repeat protein